MFGLSTPTSKYYYYRIVVNSLLKYCYTNVHANKNQLIRRYTVKPRQLIAQRVGSDHASAENEESLIALHVNSFTE